MTFTTCFATRRRPVGATDIEQYGKGEGPAQKVSVATEAHEGDGGPEWPAHKAR